MPQMYEILVGALFIETESRFMLARKLGREAIMR